MGIVLILGCWAVLPGPEVLEAVENEAQIYFAASRSTIIVPGECVQLWWNAGNIREIYINAQGQIGIGQTEMCIFPDTLPSMRIVFQDETEKTYNLNIGILVLNPLAWGLAMTGVILTSTSAILGVRSGAIILHPHKATLIGFSLGLLIYLAVRQLPSNIQIISTARWPRASESIQMLIGLFSVILFCGLIGIMKLRYSENNQDNPSIETNHNSYLQLWGSGFVSTLIVVVAIVLYVNPRGMYFSRRYEPNQLLVRGLKTERYAALQQVPDVVILGSSRAFNISPEYIRETLGYSAYNMAVEGGRIEDNLVLTRYIVDQYPDDVPEVLLVEVQAGLPRQANDIAERAPYAWLRYLRPATLDLAIQRRFESLFSIQQFSEAIYIARHDRVYRRQQRVWTFDSLDGTGMRNPVTASELQYNIEIDIGNIPPLECNQVDVISRLEIEEIAKLTERHNSAVIFYISPWHPQYYEALLRDNPEYQQCITAFREFMETFTDLHDNIFFLDYSFRESIGGDATEAGYYDSDHLTSLNSQRLIDTAAPTIRRAYDFAQRRRARS